MGKTRAVKAVEEAAEVAGQSEALEAALEAEEAGAADDLADADTAAALEARERGTTPVPAEDVPRGGMTPEEWEEAGRPVPETEEERIDRLRREAHEREALIVPAPTDERRLTSDRPFAGALPTWTVHAPRESAGVATAEDPDGQTRIDVPTNVPRYNGKPVVLGDLAFSGSWSTELGNPDDADVFERLAVDDEVTVTVAIDGREPIDLVATVGTVAHRRVKRRHGGVVLKRVITLNVDSSAFGADDDE